MKFLLPPLLLLASASAHAFSPETGLWWNPEEGGRGFSIEVQNETLVLTVFVYTPDGEPVWFQGDGDLQDRLVEGELSRKFNGQCITCEYRNPETDLGFAGPFEIQFTSATTGVLTWEGGEVPIQRFEFGWKDEIQKMLGEWQLVLDFSATAGDEYPYVGDVLIFNNTGVNEGQEQFLGYRVNSDFDRSRDVDDLGDAAGTYFPAENDAQDDLHVILVDNSLDQFLLYVIEVGTDRFEGFFELYDNCPESEQNEPRCNPTFEGAPVQGFRTASRAEVQVKSGQLDSRTKSIAGAGLEVPLLARFSVNPQARVSVKSLNEHVDVQALQAVVRRLGRSLTEQDLR